jgi:hypothetical protein
MKGHLVAAALVTWLVAQPPAATHYVTATGVSSGTCTQAAPCNAWWLTQLTAAQLPPGSIVDIADGYYSNGLALEFARNGTASQPITVRVGPTAWFTGGRVKPAVWTKTAGYAYIYETVWDEAPGGSPGGFAVGTVIQREPTTWVPILVDDRRPPFTTSAGRPFSLELPPPLKQVWTLADVEAQSGTWLASHAANRIYVHMYHDGPPAEGDDLHVGYAHGGAWHITGDYWVIEGLKIAKTSGTGLWVKPSANGTVIRNLTMQASQVWLEGTNTLAEDVDISHVIKQAPPSEDECVGYDANPAFGVGECWHAAASGNALLIGKEGATHSFGQVVRRAKVHRSWNGAYLNGANTLEDSSLWGFPNHTLQIKGVGGVLRGNVLSNGQDSLYMEGSPFGNLVIEHNIFVNAVLVWVNRDGVGGSVPGPWRFWHNVLPVLGYDDKTIQTASVDCNIYIPKDAGQNRVISITGTDANQDQNIVYATLAAAKAAALEPNSRELPWTYWTAGKLFLNFVHQAVPTFDFSSPLTVCGRGAGPGQGQAMSMTNEEQRRK